MLGVNNIELTLFTDSKSLYSLVITLSQTTELRLQFNLQILRDAFERREITNIVWIAGEENPSDDLSKPDKRNGTLAKLIETNHFNPSKVSWMQRDFMPVQTSNC